MSILENPETEAMADSMGMGKTILLALLGMPTEQAERKLADLKAALPSKFREAAFDLHPDRNSDDPRATEKFKLLVQVRDTLAGVQVKARAQPGWTAHGWTVVRPAARQTSETYSDMVDAFRFTMRYASPGFGVGVSFASDDYTPPKAK